MSMSTILDNVDSLITSSTRVPGFRRKVMIDVERLSELRQELDTSMPASVQEAHEVLKQKESIIKQAYLEAQRLKDTAEREAAALTAAAHREHQAKVDQAEIVRTAHAKAEEITMAAEQEAEQASEEARQRAGRAVREADAAATSRREGADQYSREVLFHLEERLSQVLGQVRRGIDVLQEEIEETVPA